jgi:hypothetical protein
VKEPNTSPEYDNFKSLLDRVMSVPHSVIAEREAEYKKEADANPRKRGPKPKNRVRIKE